MQHYATALRCAIVATLGVGLLAGGCPTSSDSGDASDTVPFDTAPFDLGAFGIPADQSAFRYNVLLRRFAIPNTEVDNFRGSVLSAYDTPTLPAGWQGTWWYSAKAVPPTDPTEIPGVPLDPAPDCGPDIVVEPDVFTDVDVRAPWVVQKVTGGGSDLGRMRLTVGSEVHEDVTSFQIFRSHPADPSDFHVVLVGYPNGFQRVNYVPPEPGVHPIFGSSHRLGPWVATEPELDEIGCFLLGARIVTQTVDVSYDADSGAPILRLAGYYLKDGQRLFDVAWEERLAVRANETEVFITQTATMRTEVTLPVVDGESSLIVTGHSSMWKNPDSHDADLVVISDPATQVRAEDITTAEGSFFGDRVVSMNTSGSVGFDTVTPTEHNASAPNVVVTLFGQATGQVDCATLDGGCTTDPPPDAPVSDDAGFDTFSFDLDALGVPADPSPFRYNAILRRFDIANTEVDSFRGSMAAEYDTAVLPTGWSTTWWYSVRAVPPTVSEAIPDVASDTPPNCGSETARDFVDVDKREPWVVQKVTGGASDLPLMRLTVDGQVHDDVTGFQVFRAHPKDPFDFHIVLAGDSDGFQRTNYLPTEPRVHPPFGSSHRLGPWATTDRELDMTGCSALDARIVTETVDVTYEASGAPVLTLSGYYTQGGQRLLDIVWEERFAVRENETEVFITQTATALADVALPSVGTAPSLIVTGHASMWKSATSHTADSVVISAPAAEIGAAEVDTVADTVVPVDTLGSVGFDTVSATSHAASAANVVIRVAGQRLLQSGS